LANAPWSLGFGGLGGQEGGGSMTSPAFAPSAGASGALSLQQAASATPPPTGTPYITGRAAAVQPGPLPSSAFGTSPFLLQSGSSISAAATFSIDAGFDPGHLSGGGTVTTTGTDAGGVGFTTVTDYTYGFDVSSSVTEEGS